MSTLDCELRDHVALVTGAAEDSVEHSQSLSSQRAMRVAVACRGAEDLSVTFQKIFDDKRGDSSKAGENLVLHLASGKAICTC